MKCIKLLIYSALIILLVSCKQRIDSSQLTDAIKEEFSTGNLTLATHFGDSLKVCCPDDKEAIRFVDSLLQIAERIKLDFSVSEEKVKRDIKIHTGKYSETDKSFWEENGWLEWRIVDGEKMYFNRAVANLILLKQFYEQKEKRALDIALQPQMKERLKNTTEIYNKSNGNGDPAVPVEMQITYTITVKPDAVPEGEIIRCWLPWPKEVHQRQRNIILLSTSKEDYVIAPGKSIHRTLYMETKAERGKPTLFQMTFKYTSFGQYLDLKGKNILPYIKSSDIYLKYTSEQLPQICFTPDIKRLADSITSPDDNPADIVKKIYLWFKENIPWTGALEYSIMPNIPEYVYLNRRGDCGMQTLLFMSMLRYKGIPVRWQSGWMVPPAGKNLHDWCEVYYEGIGWVPADISYDLQMSDTKAIKEFFISGIDSYRMIVNDGISGPLYPAKKYMRSEPYDFQRGEVEWSGGNLYFNKWDYDMKIDYIK